MAYPPYLQRLINFRQQQLAGQPLSLSALDSEQSDSLEVLNQINSRLRRITTVTGQLINVTSQLAQALVGTQRFAVGAPTTVFVTTIPWDSSFSTGNVSVVHDGVVLDPNAYTVADDGLGFLEVTLLAAVSSGWLQVLAFAQGAGLEVRLADFSDPANGANMVGVQDVDGHFVSTTVEGALAELANNLDALITSLGTIGNLWTSDGVKLSGGGATADWDLADFALKNVADPVDPQDAVNLRTVQALVQNLDSLLTVFIRSDGSVDFTQNQSMGDNRLTDVADPVNQQDAANSRTVNTRIAAAIENVLALNGLVSGVSRGTLVGPVTYDQLATALADADQTTSPGTVVVPTFSGVPRPGAPDHVSNRQYVDDQIDLILSGGADVTSGATADGTGPVSLVPGGEFYLTSRTEVAPQALTAPLRLVVEGNYTVDVTSSITSAFPIEIIAGGNVVIDGPVTCASLVIRAGGDITINAAIDCNVEPTWSRLLPAPNGGYWDQGVYLQAGGDLTVTANITAHDICTFSRVDTVISATLRATWRVWRTRIRASALLLGDVVATGTLQVLPGPAHGGALGTTWQAPKSAVWRQWDRVNSPQVISIAGGDRGPGGGGGTAGGAGGRGETSGAANRIAPALPGNGTNRPYLVPFHDLGRGGQGAKGDNSDGMRETSGVGGGRISVAALGGIDLTGGTLNASGGPNLDGGSGQARGGGGGGVVRAVCLGEIEAGTISADGGDSGAGGTTLNCGSGGGGMAAVLATSVGAAPTTTAAGGASGSGGVYTGGAGTVIQETLTAVQIQCFFDRGLFALPPLEPLYG